MFGSAAQANGEFTSAWHAEGGRVKNAVRNLRRHACVCTAGALFGIYTDASAACMSAVVPSTLAAFTLAPFVIRFLASSKRPYLDSGDESRGRLMRVERSSRGSGSVRLVLDLFLVCTSVRDEREERDHRDENNHNRRKSHPLSSRFCLIPCM
jgi:hypothetical protein